MIAIYLSLIDSETDKIKFQEIYEKYRKQMWYVENIDSSIDSEDSNVMEVTVNNTNTLYCNNGHSIICAWSEYGYYFELIYPSELGEKYMYNIIGKLEEIKT